MSHWVFGFGSLMWTPGFDFVEREPALLHGWHRAFSIASVEAWGSADRPGLVVALHPGGRCRGYAFAIGDKEWPDVEAYLGQRERAYRHAQVSVQLNRGVVCATTFLFDNDHPRAVGKLDLATTAQMIAQGKGRKGSSLEYFSNIVTELAKISPSTPRKLIEIKALIGDINSLP